MRIRDIIIAAVVILALALLVAGSWFFRTIEPGLDAETMPSRLLAPPPAGHEGAVAAGQRLARELVAEHNLPGLSVAVAVDGAIVWAEGFGYADHEAGSPVTPETRFRIGGVTKTITATAAGLLHERGRLDLDAPARRYVPEFPEKRWPVTTRQLLGHVAGIGPG